MTDYVMTASVFLFLAALSLFAFADSKKAPEIEASVEFTPPVEVPVAPAIEPVPVVSAEPQEPPTNEQKVEEISDEVQELKQEQNELKEEVKQLTQEIKEGKVGNGQDQR